MKNGDISLQSEILHKNSRLKIKSAKPEMLTFIIMVAVLAILMIVARNFRDVSYIVNAASRYVEFGILAMSMTFIIISGLIDLSVASTMALCATMTAEVFHFLAFPMELALFVGLLVGLGCGLLNGFLVAYMKIQPIIVTIGTMSLYRGISQLFIGDGSLGKFPKWFNSVDKDYLLKIGNVKISITIFLILLITIVMYLILKFTPIGRKIYALGTNENVALYSGVKVKQFKLWLFGVSGLFSAVAGILTMSRLLVVRYDMATGGELDVITIVLLGGTSIDGGRGNIIGTFLGWLTIVFVRSGMNVAGVKADQQMFAMGALLLISIIFPQIVNLIKTKKFDKKRV